MKYQIKYIVVLILSLNSSGILSQNGEHLFKAKCNTCHFLEKKGTGPQLQGVREKWSDAGEGELLYKWVKNSGDLISLGKSRMASAIKDFNRSSMPAQSVTNEEIDEIFNFIDAWALPKFDNDTTTGVYIADLTGHTTTYKANLNVFYVLIGMMIFLLIAIVIFASSIKNVIRSKVLNKDCCNQSEEDILKNQSDFKRSALLIVGSVFLLNSSSAMEFMEPGNGVNGEPWLLIESTDLFVLLALNVLLVFVLLYLKRLLSILVDTENK